MATVLQASPLLGALASNLAPWLVWHAAPPAVLLPIMYAAERSPPPVVQCDLLSLQYGVNVPILSTAYVRTRQGVRSGRNPGPAATCPSLVPSLQPLTE